MSERRSKRRFDKVPISFSVETEDAELLKKMPNRSDWLQRKIREERETAAPDEGKEVDAKVVKEGIEDFMERFSGFRDDTEEYMVEAMGSILYMTSREALGDLVAKRAIFDSVRERLLQAYRKKWRGDPPYGWDKGIKFGNEDCPTVRP